MRSFEPTRRATSATRGGENRSLLQWVGIALLITTVGCGNEAPVATPATTTKSQSVADGWRYLPTLREAIPEGVTVETIAEVATPDQARMHVVAAVHRPNASPQLRIEEWAFTQHNDKGVLATESDPVVVIRTEVSQPAPEALTDLRLRIAAPRAQVRRPVGLAVDGPAALLQRLAELATVARDKQATPRARVEALATLVQGFDNAVVIESHGLAAAIDALAGGKWKPLRVLDVSDRRKLVSVGEDPVALVEVTKKSAGWVVTDTQASQR